MAGTGFRRERTGSRGVPVAVSGLLSGVLVVAVNAWMQNPAGFDAGGRAASRRRSAGAVSQPVVAAHGAPLVAGVLHGGRLRAWRGLRGGRCCAGRRDATTVSALTIAMAMGDGRGRAAAAQRRLQLARSRSTQPLEARRHGGAVRDASAGAAARSAACPDARPATVRFGIEIPHGLSLLATHDPTRSIQGLERLSARRVAERRCVHLAFQVMVGCGFALVGLALGSGGRGGARAGSDGGLAAAGAGRCAAPLGFVALEAGWIVTEVGRQPWVDLRRHAHARGGHAGRRTCAASFVVFTVLYLGLGVVLVVLLRRLATAATAGGARTERASWRLRT